MSVVSFWEIGPRERPNKGRDGAHGSEQTSKYNQPRLIITLPSLTRFLFLFI